MLNFPLTPGDKYEGRCAEIYITEKQFLVYHCSICDEIYATFIDLLNHITKDHYENTKEYQEKEEGATSVATVNNSLQNYANENQFKEKEIKETKAKNNPNKEMATKATIQKILINDGIISDCKKSPQRKKPRIVQSAFKNYAFNRTKLSNRGQLNCYKESKYICGLCGFAFKEKLNLRTHLLRHSKQNNFNCSICLKKFYTKIELRLHEYRHKVVRTYLCNHCGMGFLSNQSLTKHVENLDRQQKISQKCERKNNWFVCKEEQCLLYPISGGKKGFKKSDLKTGYRHQSKKKSLPERNNRESSTDESKLSLVDSSDEYELVQTLTDLECSKKK